ncbi:MAG: type VI secretion protein [Alphaproteobacteria bacterium PA2]|nr:MAG: type VI secretion protein [Alphaproteobacteria bacterium PA2]
MTPSPNSPPPSPVFDRATRSGLQVSQPSSPWTMVLGVAGAGLLGMVTFASLSSSREARAQVQAPVQAAPQAPAAYTPPAQAVVVAPTPASVPAATAPTAPVAVVIPENDPARRLRAPAMVVDLADPAAGPAATAAAAAAARPGGEPVEPNASAEERFAARVGSGGVETARATRLRDLSRVAPQGTLIPAVLETAINSDLPGAARAVVSQDVRGFDGAQVLIPRGSKLFGQYRSGVAYAQTRAFVIWSRILTPDGVSIEIGSPSTDPLGRGGLAGQTDTHFRERFGGAILLSILNTAVAAASSQGPSTAISIGGSEAASRLTPQSQSVPVTIKVRQGTPLQVLLTRDLDFTTVAPRP